MLLPQSLFAAAPAPQPEILDVSLMEGGVLVGQAIGGEGQELAGSEIVLMQNGATLATTKADASGRFAFSGLRGGVYELASDQRSSVDRVWTQGTAPPTAQPGAVLVVGVVVARGQYGHRPLGWLSNPWILAGVVATAIAVPLALSNDDNPSQS
jgi:hypothetical protein